MENRKLSSNYISILFSVLLLFIFTGSALAEEGGTAISAGDTGWLLTSSALVLAMIIPGLALFYGGMVRDKNVLSTMMYSFISVCVVSVVWVLWGYTIAFGTDVGGIVGNFEFLWSSGVGTGSLFRHGGHPASCLHGVSTHVRGDYGGADQRGHCGTHEVHGLRAVCGPVGNA